VSQAYPVVFSLGCLAGLGWLAVRRAGSAEGNSAVLMAALLALALGLAGARLGFTALHLPYYLSNPQEILWVWEGGMSWVGGALGAVAAIAIFAWVRRERFTELADALALPALAVALASWVGCFLDACVYGFRASAGPLYPASPDLFGVVAPRWPTAAVGMIATGLLLSAMVLLEARRIPPGLGAGIALGGMALIAFVLSFTRGDAVLLIGAARLDTVAAVGVLLLAGAFIAAPAWSARR